MNSHQPCNRKECWSHKGVVKNWLRLVCHGLDTMAYEPKMDAGLQFDVLHAVAGYRFDDPYETSSFASLICIIIEELRFPGGQLGSSWMPELHGIIWLEDKSAKETVDVMVNLLTKAKQKREAKESRRRRGSRSRR